MTDKNAKITLDLVFRICLKFGISELGFLAIQNGRVNFLGVVRYIP